MPTVALRYVAAVAVIGVCAAAVIVGAGVARVGLDDLSIPASTDLSFERWTIDPALASAARDAVPSELRGNDPKRVTSRDAGLSDLLARRPLSAINWLRLARAQLSAGRPAAAVERTFVMSILTGPNEGYVMAQRGLVGIMLWDTLPPEVRSHVAADISGIFIPLTEAEKDEYRAAITAKTDATRNEIRHALVAARLFPAALERIGL